jgi:hypothetical protein
MRFRHRLVPPRLSRSTRRRRFERRATSPGLLPITLGIDPEARHERVFAYGMSR